MRKNTMCMLSFKILSKFHRFGRRWGIWFLLLALCVYAFHLNVHRLGEKCGGNTVNVSEEFGEPKNNFELDDLPLEHNLKRKCAPALPKQYQLKISNKYWQVLQSSNWTMYIFSAFYDRREMVIRFLVMTESHFGRSKNHSIWCQIWTNRSSFPILSRVSSIHSIWPKKYGSYTAELRHPYLLTCKIPGNTEDHYIQSSPLNITASLVLKRCGIASNVLKVNIDMSRTESKEDFAVCVKGLDFPHTDISVRLIEWIELLKLLGVHKIYFYEFAVHPNTKQVLNYYVQEDQIDVVPFTLPGFEPNDPVIRHEFLTHHNRHKRRTEVIPYNDCLYRLMNKYNYISLLDIDEIIIPLNGTNWNELLKSLKQKSDLCGKGTIAFYGVPQTGCFFEGIKRDWIPEIPEYFHMLQHVYKVPIKKRNIKGVKGFFNPNVMLSVINHQPRACITKNCTRYFAELGDAQLQHYKNYNRHCGTQNVKKCDNLLCLDYVEDKSIWQYKTTLIRNVNAVLKKIGILGAMQQNYTDL